MDDDSFHMAIAIIELVFIHFLGILTALSAPLMKMRATALLFGISYTIFIIFVALYLFDSRVSERVKKNTLIKNNQAISFLLLITLIFFIFCIGIGGNIAAIMDGLSASPTPEMMFANGVMNFFIFFLGPLAYISLATGYKTKESLENLNFRIGKRSLLYFIAGIPAMLLLIVALPYLTPLIEWIFDFQLAENVVAITAAQGMSISIAFVVSALTAFSEELFFRGFMQNKMGILFTTVVFTLSHISYGNLYEIIAAFILSLVMGYSVKRTKDLGFAIGMHFTNNFATIVVINYLPHLVGI
ncbi:MAG: type II CAAX endopeptidase family protein [Candidatus Thermoplasmatota archaeon]|nr:type II CAAX endopeptidase family protein [Candidatus Thermoplasmatota archaeon]